MATPTSMRGPVPVDVRQRCRRRRNVLNAERASVAFQDYAPQINRVFALPFKFTEFELKHCWHITFTGEHYPTGILGAFIAS